MISSDQVLIKTEWWKMYSGYDHTCWSLTIMPIRYQRGKAEASPPPWNHFSVSVKNRLTVKKVAPVKWGLREIAKLQSLCIHPEYQLCYRKVKCSTNKCKCKQTNELKTSKCQSSCCTPYRGKELRQMFWDKIGSHLYLAILNKGCSEVPNLSGGLRLRQGFHQGHTGQANPACL